MSDDLLTRHQRDLNCLGDADRATRRRALTKLHKALAPGGPEAEAFFVAHVLPHAARLLEDSVEKCREVSLLLLRQFAPGQGRAVFEACLPVIVGRLNAVPFPEPTEELRLQLVELCTELLRSPACAAAVPEQVPLLAPMFAKALGDSFSDVKREVCASLAALLAVEGAGDALGPHVAPLIRALLPNLGHQHSKTRQCTLRAMTQLLLLESDVDQLMEEHVLPAWDKVWFDRTAAVRRQLLESTAELLPRREQHAAALLPVLLAGLTDDTAELQQTARESLERAAAPASSAELVKRLLPLVINPLLQRTDDWTARSRERGAAVLLQVIVFAAADVTQFLPQIVSTLAQGCRDPEPEVAARVGACASALAGAVAAGPLLDALLGLVRGQGGPGMDTPQHRVNGLVLLAAAMPGLPTADLVANLAAVAAALAQAELVESDNAALRLALLHALEAVVEAAGAALDTSEGGVRLNVLVALTHLLGGEDAVAADALENIDGLAEACGVAAREQLYQRDADALVALLAESVAEQRWSKASPKRFLFDALVRHAGAALAAHAPAVMALFRAHLDADCDADLRLAMLALLESAVGTDGLCEALSPHAADIVVHCVLPNCVWRAGRVAATIRKIALAALYTLLHRRVATQQTIFQVAGQVLPVLKSCMDDEDAKTRQLVCLCLHYLFAALPDSLSAEPVRELYPELLKRLDDSNDEVRRAVCRTFIAFLHATPAEVFRGTWIDCSLDTLLVHLDDPEEAMQAAVLEVLLACVPVDRELVIRKATEARTRHRTPVFCDRLLAAIPPPSI